MNKQFHISIRGALLVLAFLLVFSSGYLTGRSGFVVERSSETGGPVVKKEVGQPKEIDFSLFWEAWDVVEDKYVNTPDDKERVYGAISGMIAGLGDPFSTYMKPAESERFSEEISGNFEGIGAELVQKDGFITVVAPLESSPAQKAGVMAGDIIVKVDNEPTPTTLEEAVKKIRGKKGTRVTLTIVRNGEQREFTITRDKVEIKSASYTLKDNGVAVIKINQFNANTVSFVDDALAKATQDKVKGLVLDMRNNPGGLLSSSVEIASRFMEPGVVVIERDKTKQETPLTTVAVTNRTSLPLVVLVNKGSASASEIVAGALQDGGRAKVMGETTFGKGSVQSIEPLKDGSSVRITVAEWLTPKKREINKVGIKPDTEVLLTDEDIKTGKDPQLEAAIQSLQ